MRKPTDRRAFYFLLFCLLLSQGHIHAAPDLLASWTFDTSSGDTYTDVTGHGYNATSAGLSLAAGVKGKALNCPASGYELVVANSIDSFNLTKFSVEGWIYLNQAPTEPANFFDFSRIDQGIRNGYGIIINEQQRVVFGISSSDGAAWASAVSVTTIGSLKWYHIACTYDGAALRIYINGILDQTTPYAGIYVRPLIDAHIGCQRAASGAVRYHLNGKIDELKFYNGALSSDAITTDFNSLTPYVKIIPLTPNSTLNRRPTLRWNSMPSVETYKIQISSQPSFSSIFLVVPTTDTSYQPTIDLPFGVHYWRVANNADSNQWSIVSSFTILDPAVPILVSVHPDPTRNRRPMLMWSDVEDTGTYTIQVSTVPYFTSPFIQTQLLDSFYVPTVDLPFGSIYWRVKASTRDQYSGPDTFVVISDSVPMPIDVVPDSQYNRKPTLTWFSAKGATVYRIQIDTSKNFGNPLVSVPSNDTFYTPTAELPLGKIYWRVSAGLSDVRYAGINKFFILPKTGLLRSMSEINPERLLISSARLGRGIEITFSLERPGEVSLDILSTSGKTIARIFRGVCQTGNHRFVCNGSDARGWSVPSGSYLVVGRLNEKNAVRKILLFR